MSTAHIKDVDYDKAMFLTFYCPGCLTPHMVMVSPDHPGPRWEWNKDWDKPTFKPSVLSNKNRSNPMLPRCHSFVTDGYIRFLPDCTHDKAGQTVELPTVDQW